MTTFSCIFPVLNGGQLLINCLHSLVPQLLAGDEIIVVDNGSIDGTPDRVAQDFPQVRLIRAGDNLGYGGGANRGLHVMRAQAAIILNHDLTVLDGCLAALRQRLEVSGPAIIGCKLLYPDGHTIQHAGGIIRGPRAQADHHGYRQVDDGRWDELAQPDYVTGALFVIDRAVLAACGEFDEQFYPLYYEEVDYCYRARRAGFPVIYEPAAIALHHETVTYAARSMTYHRLMERGRVRFVLKNYPPDQLLTSFFPAEKDYVQHVDAAFARDVCVPMYDDVLTNLPPLPPEHAAEIMAALRQLRATARHVAAQHVAAQHSVPHTATLREVSMPEPLPPLNIPALREHEFQSSVPVVGPVIAGVRRALYALTAKWPLRVALDQQTHINQQLVQRLYEHEGVHRQHEAILREYEAQLRAYEAQLRNYETLLHEYDERLIDQDHDLAQLSRLTAEVEVRQRHLSKA